MNFRSTTLPLESKTCTAAVSILAGIPPARNLHDALAAAQSAGFERQGPGTLRLCRDSGRPGAPEIAILVVFGSKLVIRTNTIPGSSLDERAARTIDGLAS